MINFLHINFQITCKTLGLYIFASQASWLECQLKNSLHRLVFQNYNYDIKSLYFDKLLGNADSYFK